MSDDNQIIIPASFIALYVPPGRIKPSAPRETIAERHDFCEDLAAMLTDHAKTMQWELGIAESDVLERCHRGLLAESSGVSRAEAGWVIRRLAELLDWTGHLAAVPGLD